MPALFSSSSPSNHANLEPHSAHPCNLSQTTSVTPFIRYTEHNSKLSATSSAYSFSAVTANSSIAKTTGSNLTPSFQQEEIDATFARIDDTEKKGTPQDSETLAKLLSCAQFQSLSSVRRACRIIMSSDPRPISSTLNQLASLYCKLGGTSHIHQLFDATPQRRYAPKRRRDDADPKRKRAYEKVMELHQEMRAAGYVPDTRHVLHDLDKEGKERALMYHSERVAIAYGLISTAPGTTLRVMKNLRICVDCHNAVKFISELEGREIIVRDNKRFHHFSGGVCSCRDYW